MDRDIYGVNNLPWFKDATVTLRRNEDTGMIKVEIRIPEITGDKSKVDIYLRSTEVSKALDLVGIMDKSFHDLNYLYNKVIDKSK